MADLLIRDVRLATRGGARGWLRARAGRVTALGVGDPPPATAERILPGEGHWLLPGFVDAHVHGAFGEDVMAADSDGLRRLARRLVTTGVTAFAPTLWTATPADTIAALRAVAAVLGDVAGGATVLSAHVEGPYLSARRCGAQPPASIRASEPAELEDLAGTGALGRMTVAPEASGNDTLVTALVQAGVEVSLGHSDADADASLRAVDQGARGVTHLFNAMPPLHHRAPGLVGVALTDDRLLVEIIPDGVHVHPVALRAAWAALGPERLALVTDALPVTGLEDPTTGMPAGAELRDGAVWLDRDTLAGSCLTLDAGLRTFADATGADPSVLWPTVSRTPAGLAGVAGDRGDLVPGLVADAVLLDDRLEVVATVARGVVVHDRRTVAGPTTAAPREAER